MGNIGSGEILVLFIVGLLVLGPERLPEVGKKIGKIVTQMRQMSSSFQEELRAAVEDPTIEMKARAKGALLSQKEEDQEIQSSNNDETK